MSALFLQVGASVDCTVQIAREDYAVVTYGTSAKDFAFLSVNDFNARDNLTAQLLPISSIHKLTMSMHPSMDTGNPHFEHHSNSLHFC